jgi:uncharacterized membrane protein YczE
METKHLVSVERWTLILAATAIAVSVLLLGRQMAFGISVGAALMALNAYALRRIGMRAFKTFKKPGLAVLLFNLKMGVLIALVWAVIRYLHVDPIAFLVGISVFPLAVVVVAIRHAFASDADAPNGESHG